MRSINLNNFDMMGVKNKIYSSSLSIKKGSSVILHRFSYVHYSIYYNNISIFKLNSNSFCGLEKKS